MILAASSLLSLGFGFAQSACAQQPNTIDMSPQTETQQASRLLNVNTKTDLDVQNFVNDGLSVQFRYVDRDLRYIRLENLQDKPISVNILNENYVLGAKDTIIIDPPDVSVIRIGKEPYFGLPTLGDNIFPHRFANYYIYELPLQRNVHVLEGGIHKSDQKVSDEGNKSSNDGTSKSKS